MIHINDIKHLASNLESIDSEQIKTDALITPSLVFKIGSILYYEARKKERNQTSTSTTSTTNEDQYHNLAMSFQNLLRGNSIKNNNNNNNSSDNENSYLSQVIFHDLYTAFEQVLQSSFYEPLRKRTTTKKFNNDDDINYQKWFKLVASSISPIWGIHNALMVQKENYLLLLPCAFDTSFCHQLVTLYDFLTLECDFVSPVHDGYHNNNYGAAGGDDSDTNEEIHTLVNEILNCILNILSSLLSYGFIFPLQNKMDIREDEKIQQIMEVLQGMLEDSYSSTTSSYCLGDLQLWQKQQQQQQERQSMKNGTNDVNSTSIESYTKPLSEIIQFMFTDDVQAQKEYLLLVLSSAPTSPSSLDEQMNKTENQSNGQSNLSKVQQRQQQQPNQRKESALDRLIQQVHQILPHLGKGYIEAALACYNHDLEQTTNALMEGEINPTSLHPRLRAIDKSLPERRKESRDTYDSFGSISTKDNDQKEEEEARKIQRERIKQMVASQEDEAYKLGVAIAMNDIEYNDDYDDQYDGIGDGIGGADSGLYDVDFESIKAYNRVTKEMEADRLFWEENRNINRRGGGGNRKQSNNQGDEDNGDENNEDVDGDEEGSSSKQKSYRGPDKGKGGRIIGPDGKYLPHPKHRKKGGKGNQNSTGSNKNATSKNSGNEKKDGQGGKSQTEMSKIQKRRKNDNKAKIANHHRKERALKKTGA